MIFCGTQQHATDAISRAQVFFNLLPRTQQKYCLQLQLAVVT